MSPVAWSLFGQRMLDGLANGSLYGSLALAITLVYRSTGRVNLAQGELATVGTYFALVLVSPVSPALAGTALAARWLPATPWPSWLAIPAAIAASALLAALLERFVVRRIATRDPRATVSLTVALLLLINATTATWWGVRTRGFPSPFPHKPHDQFIFAGVRLRYTTIGTWLTLLAVLAVLQLLLFRSRFGLAFRAVASDHTNSALCGVRVSRILTGSWALAAALGTLVGCISADRLLLSPMMMTRLLVYALVAASIGGLSSPAGALVGGIVVGVGQSMLGGYAPRVGSVLAFPLVVVAMIIMLYVRPGGLFGAGALRSLRADDAGSTAAAATARRPDVVAPRWRIARTGALWHVGRGAVLAVGIAVAVVPTFLLPYAEARMVTEIVALAIALWGLGFLVGDAGQISLAHATFIGVGAYTTAIVGSRYHVHPFVGVAVAAVIGFGVGGLLALPAIRIRGQYLAMVTFAVAVVFPALLNRFAWLTGGEFGPRPSPLPLGPRWLGLPADRGFLWTHLVCVAAAVVLGWVVTNLRRSPFGRAVRAGTEHETGALSVGVPVTRVRTLAFATSTALAAIGGGFSAVQSQAVTANRYDVMRSVAMYAMVAVFGAGSLTGATLAAAAFVITPWLFIQFSINLGAQGVMPGDPGGGAYLLWGVALVVMTLALPGGVVPRIKQWSTRFVQFTDVEDDRIPAGS